MDFEFSYADGLGNYKSLIHAKNPQSDNPVATFGITKPENDMLEQFSLRVDIIESALSESLIEVILGELGKFLNCDDFYSYVHLHHSETPYIFKWFSPFSVFYVYRITAPRKSDKFYIGVHRTKKSGVTVGKMRTDGYLGSGGVKYQRWKEKYSSYVEKEVLGVFQKRSEAYLYERLVVGDRYKTDENCLNSKRGGIIGPSEVPEMKKCKKHGMTNHRNGECARCNSRSPRILKNCETHGMVYFIGEHCIKCVSAKSRSIRVCEKHGKTKFNGDTCVKCLSERIVHIGSCDIHGNVAFAGNSCISCFSQKSVHKDFCPKHGVVNFQGDSCYICAVEVRTTKKTCKIHGLTAHQGNSCCKCASNSKQNFRNCEKHGFSSHQNDKCAKCAREKSNLIKVCQTHGKTKFNGEKCVKCYTAKSFHFDTCEKHGYGKYRGRACMACVSEKRQKTKELNKKRKTTSNSDIIES